MGSLVDVECIKIKRGKVLSNIRLVNIPTGLFVVENELKMKRGTCVWLTNWKEGGGQFQWGDGPSQGHENCATHSGERETQKANKISGEERLPVEW